MANHINNGVTHARLLDVLHYSPDTGIFQWRVTLSNRAKAGKCAGHVHDTGRGKSYSRISIDGVEYYAHRLAWFYLNGTWPDNKIDHKNLDGMNNTPSNIRNASNPQNGWNVGLNSRNSSGCKHVHWDSCRNKWRVVITYNGKIKCIGRFDDFECACQVADKWRDKLHGEYARRE
jgi:hypothetical protein